jgi:pectate lyase-like protein
MRMLRIDYSRSQWYARSGAHLRVLWTTALTCFLLVPACLNESPSAAIDPTTEREADASGLARSTFYVSPLGSDTNPGTSDAPFGSIAFALGRLRPGDTLYVRGGTYHEKVKVKARPGRKGARVLVSAYPGERPVIEGQLWIGYPTYWTIDGINVTWASDNPNEPMVRLYGGTRWVLQNAEIWGAHSTSGLHIDDGPSDVLGWWKVRNNCIHDTYATNGINQDHNLYIDDMAESPNPSGLIKRNLLFNATNGRGIKLGPGDTGGGPVNVVVRHNTIYNSVQNISLSRDAANVRLFRNLLVNASEANIRGFRLRGKGNIARANYGAGSPKLILNDPGYRGIQDLGENVAGPVPSFDLIGCAGFHPAAPLPYGVYR